MKNAWRVQMARKQAVCLAVWMHCTVCVCVCAWVNSHWPRTTGHPVSRLLRWTHVDRRRKWWRQASQTRSIACKICYGKNAANVMCCCCCCWWLLRLLTAHVQQQTVPNKWPSAFSCCAASCTWSAKWIHLFVLFCSVCSLILLQLCCKQKVFKCKSKWKWKWQIVCQPWQLWRQVKNVLHTYVRARQSEPSARPQESCRSERECCRARIGEGGEAQRLYNFWPFQY